MKKTSDTPRSSSFASLLSRRNALTVLGGGLVIGAGVFATNASADNKSASAPQLDRDSSLGDIPLEAPGFDKLTTAEWQDLPESEWKKRLSKHAYYVLREEGTERAFTSELNNEKRDGWFACAGCGQILFSSAHKYNSGTGWPSFWEVLPGRIDTKPDRKLFYVRTEYHCSRCGGHQGHVFDDGPAPTGQRWCNNGVALTFIPSEAAEA